MKMKADEACLSCKVVSVSCLLAIGGYLFYLGKHQPKSKHVLYTLGTVSGGLGIGEVFDKSPFRQT